MANKWFRLYHEFATDPKVQMLSEADQRRFVMLLCLRCSNDDETLQDDEVAFQLRISNEEYQQTKRILMDKNLIDDNNKPPAWAKHQLHSDSSTQRVRAHRAKAKKTAKRPCNVSVTPPDTDTEDKKEKQTKERQFEPLKKGTELSSAALEKGTEPNDKKALNEVQSNSPVSSPDKKRKEKQAKEKKDDNPNQSEYQSLTETVFQHWKRTMAHPQAKLDAKRKRTITAALKIGYTPEQLRQAIEGCAKTPHNMGENERGQRYDDLTLVLRDADHIDRFIRHYRAPPAPRSARAEQRAPSMGSVYS